MRFLIFLLLFAFVSVQSKNHVKSLTESMGQEVIEIGTPIKAELPPGLDEEPSAEFEDDEKTTSTSVQPATKRETRKTTTISTTTEPTMTSDGRRYDVLNQEEEERKIEKELSEIYKDTDYKADTTKEVLKTAAVLKEIKTDKPKPIARARANFKFQPDVNDRADVERFRTSVDEISCDKRVTQRLKDEDNSSASGRLLTNSIAMSLAFLSIFVCQ